MDGEDPGGGVKIEKSGEDFGIDTLVDINKFRWFWGSFFDFIRSPKSKSCVATQIGTDILIYFNDIVK